MSDLPAMMYDLESGVRQEAGDALMRILGTEEGGRLSAKVAVAFRQSVAAAKNPEDLLNCSAASISTCVLQVVLTGIAPGGPATGCYLIPKKGVLQYWINHRGFIELARRAGQKVKTILAFPGDDHRLYEDQDGVHFRHESKHDPAAETYAHLEGVYVVVRDGANKLVDVIWVSKSMIAARRGVKDSGPVWNTWPLEMAQKTAIKYAVGRGTITLSVDPGVAHALSVEQDQEIEDTTATAAPSGRLALGIALPAEAPAPPLPQITAGEAPMSEELFTGWLKGWKNFGWASQEQLKETVFGGRASKEIPPEERRALIEQMKRGPAKEEPIEEVSGEVIEAPAAK